MRPNLFYTLTLAGASGILLQTLFSFQKATIVWFLFLSFILAVLWRRSNSLKGITSTPRFVLLASVALLGFSLGAIRLYVAEETFNHSAFDNQVGETVSIEGVVVQEPDVRERSTQLFVQTGDELLLVRADRYAGISYGDRVRAEGTLEVPEPFETDLGRTFNYPGYLKAQGVTHLISFAQVEALAHGEGYFVVEQLLGFKQRFIKQLETVIPEPHVGLAEGLLLGVKSGLGDELEEAFRSVGIIHIVVLSGYNVMLVIAFVLYGLAFVVPFRSRLVIGLVAIIAFALLVGLSATVLRASVMATLLLVARFTGRAYAILRALVIAGIAMLLVNPYLLAYDVGFQLSFVATLGLILLAPWIQTRLTRVPTWLGAREFLTATIAAQLFVTPLLLYQIGQFSIVAVLINVLVLPMVPVAMLLTFLTGLASFISANLATLLGYLAYLSLAYIIRLAESFASLPFAAVVVPVFPFVVVIAAYIVIAYCAYRIHYQKTHIVPVKNSQREEFNVSEWTIIEESVLRAQLKSEHIGITKAAEVHASTAPDTLPIFFR